ncbi:3-deoxy-D-manno-octulosonic acid transferase [Rhodobacter ferrooxidans]|uniref:3-deoxy-D-manno-octulosonic acid transferase n=1 Tax=Rhodobacter ferrooxidans TaxID=371731 RepID=C8S093_9RHOB|nr:glycosyltransferase N-terminal domain-containing protein [Rhodobacter sp. SW2]EEW25702.1 Three-deoxy-D-manno-octulosonic-acid transferase domain protein [Rhodobacter sp. SW2]
MQFYRFLMRLALPVLLAMVLVQILRGRLPRAALAERLGRAGVRPSGRLLWLHGASNGELTSVRWLVERLLADDPSLSLLVTCNSASGRAMVQGWGLPRLSVQLAPFDVPGVVRRHLARWQPQALVTVENELWPERLRQMAALGPVLLIGARMSQRSADRWARLAPGVMGETLQRLRAVSAQDAGSEARLLALGLPEGRLLSRLMLKAQAAPVQAVAPFEQPVPRARCLLAASTHEGEDALILDAFAAARAAGRFDLLILAPRHPRRSAAIAGLIAARGFDFATRSKGEVPGPRTAVYLADTLGEMAGWYGMAGVTIIGGSFGEAGGHTPYEPAALGSALIHGPSVANFAESFAALDAGGAAVSVADGKGLAGALLALDAGEQQRLAARAQAVLVPGDDATALLEAIRAALSG